MLLDCRDMPKGLYKFHVKGRVIRQHLEDLNTEIDYRPNIHGCGTYLPTNLLIKNRMSVSLDLRPWDIIHPQAAAPALPPRKAAQEKVRNDHIVIII